MADGALPGSGVPGPRPGGGRPAAGAERLFTTPFVLTCLATCMFFLSHQLVLMATPLYALERGGSEADAGTLTLVFSLAALVSRLPIGWVMDRWGRRPVMLAGTGIAVACALLYPGVAAMPGLLALRPFHGVALGIFTAASAAVIVDVVPPARRGEGMGYFGWGNNLPMAFGPMLSLALVSRFGFTTVFLVSAAVATIGTALGAGVRETGARVAAPLSLRPGTIFVPSAVFPGLIVGALTVNHGALVTFLPLMGKARAIGNPGAFFTVAAILLILIRAKAGTLSDLWGRGPVILPGMFLTALAMVLLGLSHGPGSLLAAGALYGVGLALAQPALMAMVGDRAGEADRGRAISTFYTGWELGIGAGAYPLGYLLSRTNFTVMFVTAGLVTALGGIGYLLAPGRPRRRSGATATREVSG
ncbi:MAG TPA: MFS transporter [Candidatus Methylomirabilis sp.]